ncbi:MAG: InlB B-repeat-containing protein [Flavobacteriaceae bacterium]|nr:InlB B-repeat-containing protein [Flavobacteriaceae bacterium]
MIFRNNSSSIVLLIVVTTLNLFSCTNKDVDPISTPPAKFTITTSAGPGGTISGSQSSIESGQSVKITATAQQHYQLKEWTGDCGSFSKDDLEIAVTASKNCEVRGEFKKISYTITATSTAGGSVDEAELSREQGQTATFTAVPDEGYEFSGWQAAEDTDCPTFVNPSNTKVSFTVAGDCSLEALFVQAPRTISTSVGEGGEITETQTVNDGEEVVISATPEDHYLLKSWEGSCGEFNSEEATISFIASKNCEIKAVFEKVEYSITIISSKGGSVSESELIKEHDQTVTLTVTPEEGYVFDMWETAEDTDCPKITDASDPKLEFTVVGDCQLRAIFTESIRIISTSADEGGEITPTQEVNDGEEVVITATAQEHYQLGVWEGNCGEFNSEETTISFIASKDCEIKAAFTKVSYTISAKSADGGNVEFSESEFEFGDSVTITARADDGYIFNQWSVSSDSDCPEIDTTNEIIQIVVEGDCHLEASFTFGDNSDEEQQGTTETDSTTTDTPINTSGTTGTLWAVGDAVPGGWDFNDDTVEFTQTIDGIWSANIELKHGVFRFLQTFGTWDTNNNYAYYSNEGFEIDANFENDGSGDENFRFIGIPGSYTLAIDANNKMINLEEIETRLPSLWAVGDAVPGGWDFNSDTVEFPQVTENVWTAEIALSSGGIFRFFQTFGTWDTNNNYAFYSGEGYTIDSNFSEQDAADKNFLFTGTTGSYVLTINGNDKTITLE